nr:DUF2066 domain-containing protein [Sansalvadorimonas sp. 2012CJ34-2]
MVLVIVLPVQASDSLYETQIPVKSQGGAARQAGFQRGLEVVLQRLTGQSDLRRLPSVAEAGRQANKLVSRFDYRDIPEQQLIDDNKYLLRVRFSQSAVNQLLRENHLPIWGETRPSVLVWLAQENTGRREFVSPEAPSFLRSDMNREAQEWGLPLVYPLFDFEDSLALSISDMWGLFADPILNASRRYGVNAVMAVRIWPAGDQLINGRALFIFRGQVMSFDFQGVQPNELSSQLVAQAAGQMAAFYAVAPEGADGRPIRIQVDDIANVSDYADLIRYLESLTAVRSVMPVKVKGSRIMLDVVIDGSMDQLDAAISLGRKLAVSSSYSTPKGMDPSQIKGTSDLQYRWR